MLFPVILLLIFSGCCIYFVKQRADHTIESCRGQFLKLESEFEKEAARQIRVVKQKKLLEGKAAETFALFDITKEITKKLNEKEAFAVFKEKLKGMISFADCQFVSYLSDDERKLHDGRRHFIFSLQSKREKLGFLTVEGLSLLDQDKFIILANQFALGLRRVKLYEEVEGMAITDSLTGACTRRHLMERFEVELQRAVSRKLDLSVVMIDVDHFKRINDHYGHLAGDQVLKNVGSLIKENIREIDLVGRFGGEEFFVILPDTDRAGAQFAAERIREAIEAATIKAYDLTLQVTVSAGVSTYPIHGKNMEELIDKADWGLYQAKKRGRNCVCAFGMHP